VTAGWQFSTLSLLPEEARSWTDVLDHCRIASQQTQGEVMAGQLQPVTPLLPGRALFAGDGYYGSVTFLLLTEDIARDKLVRFAKNRVLYRQAPPRTGKRGAPKKDGAVFKCQLGTPARLPQVRGKSPGRSPGATIQPAPRYKVIYKAMTKVSQVV
jgi:hypothetical protein